ncbi:MAG: Hsp20/alpha crystallin family protein [Cytophagaceae bacterium]
MALTKWRDPSAGVPTVSDFFKDFFKPGFMTDFLGEMRDSSPAVNIVESDKEFRVEVAAPGMTKENFELKLENNIITISGRKEDKKEEGKENEQYWHKEFSYSSFQRSFSLPENTDPEKIQANYQDGLLCVNIPKKEVTIKKEKAKTIKIN